MSLPPLTNHQLATYRRNPYANSSIHIEKIFYKNPLEETFEEKIFRRTITQFHETYANDNSEFAKTVLLKRIASHNAVSIQLSFAVKLFNSVSNTSDPEFYSTLLYIIKKEERKELFPLAHDILLKAVSNKALSNWVVIHYLTIGMNSSKFQFLYPVIEELSIKFPSKIPEFLIRNYMTAAGDNLLPDQENFLKNLLAKKIQRREFMYQNFLHNSSH